MKFARIKIDRATRRSADFYVQAQIARLGPLPAPSDWEPRHETSAHQTTQTRRARRPKAQRAREAVGQAVQAQAAN